MTLRNSPSGPIAGYKQINQTGTIAIIAAAGDAQAIAITSPDFEVGDVAVSVQSLTALNGGVVLQGGICTVAGTMSVSAIGTKAFAGAVATDFVIVVYRDPP